MSDAETTNAMRSQPKLSPQRDPNHPLPMWPMAHIYPEPGEISATEGKATAADGQESDDAVAQPAGALRPPSAPAARSWPSYARVTTWPSHARVTSSPPKTDPPGTPSTCSDCADGRVE